MPVLVLLAVSAKLLDSRRAASWQSATGRILSSQVEQRAVRIGNEPEQIENYAAVTYEFKTATGRKVVGSRIGIGDDYRNADAAPKVKLYPAGANVTVYYDRNDPANCVLDRSGLMTGMDSKGCMIALAELAIAGGILWALIVRGPDFVKARFPKANASTAVMAFGIGVFLCMLAYAQWRMSKAAKGWPTVAGEVVRSEVESYRERVGGATGELRTFYRPVIEYAYAVAGHEYRSAQIRLNTSISGGLAWAERAARKYPQGRAVSVYHDPADPSNAILENPGSVSWYLLTLATLALAFSAWQTHLFG